MRLDVHSILHRTRGEPEPPRAEQSASWSAILSRIDNKAYPDSVLSLHVEVVCALASLARCEADFADLKRKAVALASSIRDPRYRNLANRLIEALRWRLPGPRGEPEAVVPLVERATPAASRALGKPQLH
jgi:hypothetical protein